MEIFIVCCIIIAAGAIVALTLINKKSKERDRYISAAMNIYRDSRLSAIIKNPALPSEENVNADFSEFIFFKELGEKNAHEYVFSLSQSISIGRSRRGNRIILEDELVSEYQCNIYLSQSGVVLRDINSANGELIRRGAFKKLWIGNGNSAVLQDKDKITIGCTEFMVRIFSLR